MRTMVARATAAKQAAVMATRVEIDIFSEMLAKRDESKP